MEYRAFESVSNRRQDRCRARPLSKRPLIYQRRRLALWPPTFVAKQKSRIERSFIEEINLLSIDRGHRLNVHRVLDRIHLCELLTLDDCDAGLGETGSFQYTPNCRPSELNSMHKANSSNHVIESNCGIVSDLDSDGRRHLLLLFVIESTVMVPVTRKRFDFTTFNDELPVPNSLVAVSSMLRDCCDAVGHSGETHAQASFSQFSRLFE